MIGPIIRLTLRALLRQKRAIMLALIALAPAVTAAVYALARPAGSNVLDFYSGLVQQLFVPTVAALIALVFGVSAFGDEREDGTILYLVATPQPRIELVIAKVTAAWVATLVLVVPSLVLTAVFALEGRLTAGRLGWPLLGVVLATLAYCAAASWLSLRTRRPIIIGIIYILLWEGSIATFAPSAAKLSISAYGRAFVAHALPQAARPVTGALTAAVVLIAVVALAAWGAARALVRGELP